MKQKISAVAMAAAVVALAGCAPSQMTAFINGSGNHDQTPATVIPGRVMTVSPVSHVAIGLFAPKVKGEDVIVRPFSPPRNLISVVQPIPASGPLKPGNVIGVTTQDGKTRVILMPDYNPKFQSAAIQPFAKAKP